MLITSDTDVDVPHIALIIRLKFPCAYWTHLDHMILNMAYKQLLWFSCIELQIAYWTRAIDNYVRCIFKPTRTQTKHLSITKMQFIHFTGKNFIRCYNIPFLQYDTRCHFNVCPSKADKSELNLPHGTNN